MLESTVSKNVFEGNGSATVFPFTFRVWKTSELQVSVTSPEGRSEIVTDWTAELTESGGSLTYLRNGAPLSNGWKLAVTRDMPFTQEVNLITGTSFDPEVIETALDMAAAERQQLRERLARAVVVEPSSSESPEELLQNIYESEDNAAQSAAESTESAAAAAGSASAADASAGAASGSAAAAAEQRVAACSCAQRAETAAEAAEASADRAQNTLVQPPTATTRGDSCGPWAGAGGRRGRCGGCAPARARYCVQRFGSRRCGQGRNACQFRFL